MVTREILPADRRDLAELRKRVEVLEARLTAEMTNLPRPEGATPDPSVKRLVEAAEAFCAKVESGEARSKRSYAAFKEALSDPALAKYTGKAE